MNRWLPNSNHLSKHQTVISYSIETHQIVCFCPSFENHPPTPQKYVRLRLRLPTFVNGGDTQLVPLKIVAKRLQCMRKWNAPLALGLCIIKIHQNLKTVTVSIVVNQLFSLTQVTIVETQQIGSLTDSTCLVLNLEVLYSLTSIPAVLERAGCKIHMCSMFVLSRFCLKRWVETNGSFSESPQLI